jgi:hypothetical protein
MRHPAPSGKMADSSRETLRDVARAPEKIGLAGFFPYIK